MDAFRGYGCRKMSGNVTELRPKQQEAILALLTNATVEQAARAVNITPRTLYRWLQESLFNKAYRKACRDAFGQGTARLQQASGAAVSSILKIMLDQHAPVSTKLRAAELVLTQGARALELEDVEARVAELERKVEAAKASQARGGCEVNAQFIVTEAAAAFGGRPAQAGGHGPGSLHCAVRS